ncbi:MAG: DUF1266 domain-containing protein [Deltaproteobacteria bacterium]|jgi:hypothetical protein|nr:DUF1266 domain-containing protein [Deltaproteobacteria bacterium]
MGLLDSIVDLIGGDKNKEFIEKHRVPSSKEPLLTVGAILTYANQHPAQVLATLPDNDPRDILSTMQIHNGEGLRESVAWLFNEGNRFEMDEMFKAYKGGNSDALSGVQKKMYENMLEYMDGNPLYEANRNIKKMTRAFAEAVDGCIAWDVERAAFWTRMAANAGFIPEDEAWEILRVCHEFVKNHFSTWAEYLVSFMNGRILVMCNPDHEQSMREVFDRGCSLGAPKWGAIWAMYPLG